MSIDDEMNEVVTCKYCGGKSLYGEMTWLNGKEMCPKCYMNERAAEDAKLKDLQRNLGVDNGKK